MKHTENKTTNNVSTENALAMKVSGVSIAVNLLLSVFKLIAGILAHSGAMISDAVHSASDVGSTFIVMIGVTLSGKKSDKEHQYGHERMECVSSIILSGLLLEMCIRDRDICTPRMWIRRNRQKRRSVWKSRGLEKTC